jgi:hypothetical protein
MREWQQKKFASDLADESASSVRSVAGTQTYLAVHTGLGRPFISNVETGKKEPCLRSVEILAMGFEMSVSQLMRGV